MSITPERKQVLIGEYAEDDDYDHYLEQRETTGAF